METKKLTAEELESFKNVRKIRLMWYLSASEEIYKEYAGIRLTDAQLAKILTQKYGGTESAHTALIRRTRCNDKQQPYVSENL